MRRSYRVMYVVRIFSFFKIQSNIENSNLDKWNIFCFLKNLYIRKKVRHYNKVVLWIFWLIIVYFYNLIQRNVCVCLSLEEWFLTRFYDKIRFLWTFSPSISCSIVVYTKKCRSNSPNKHVATCCWAKYCVLQCQLCNNTARCDIMLGVPISNVFKNCCKEENRNINCVFK